MRLNEESRQRHTIAKVLSRGHRRPDDLAFVAILPYSADGLRSASLPLGAYTTLTIVIADTSLFSMDNALGQAVPERFWVIDSPLGKEVGHALLIVLGSLTPRWCASSSSIEFFSRFLAQTAYEL